ARTHVARRLAELADRLPLAQHWDIRRAHIVLGILWAATVGALLTKQGQAFPLLIVASAAFAFLLVMEARRSLLDPKLILWSSIVLIAIAVLVPPRESADVWSYAMYGRMVDHFHANPYRVSPLIFSGDPWLWRVVAGVALGLAALVKLIALLPAGALVVWLWRREGRAAALRMGAVIGGLVGAGYLLIGGLPALASLQEASRLVDRFSLWGPFGQPKPVSPLGQGPLG